MDFHSLARRDLQTLCKKNRIPANMTNVAMADALQALQSVEGLAEIQEALQFRSPVKLDLASPALPRTTRRTTASRKEAAVPKEQQASPLPRARRVTARALEIPSLADEAVEKEVAETPKVEKEVAETPKVPNTRRRARQSTKKEVEQSAVGVGSMMSTGLRRSARVRGKAAAAVKMASLVKEAEEEEQEKEVEAVGDQKNNLSYEETTGEEKIDEKDGNKKLNLESKAIEVVVFSADGSEKSSEFVEEQEKDEVDDARTGLEGSPIRGLILSDQDSYPVTANGNLEKAAAEGVESIEISTVEISREATESLEDNGELTEEIEESAGSDEITTQAVESGNGDGKITAETTESIEDNGDRDGKITAEGEKSTGEIVDDQVSTVEISTETTESIDGNGKLTDEIEYSVDGTEITADGDGEITAETTEPIEDNGACDGEITAEGEKSMGEIVADQVSTVEISTETTESIDGNGKLTNEIEDSADGTEITADGDGEITAHTTEPVEDNGDCDGKITAEGEKSTGETVDDQVSTVEISTETTESIDCNRKLTDEIEDSADGTEITADSDGETVEISTETTESIDCNRKLTDEIEDSADGTEITAISDGEITAETMESIEDNGDRDCEIMEEREIVDDQISTVEISTETTESIEENSELTEEIEDPAVCEEITTEAVESGDGDGEITEEGERTTGEDLAVDIPVEVDECGGDLESGALSGEITVETVEVPEPSEVIDRESLDEMIDSLSGLNLSSKIAGDKSNKENGGGLTALTAVEAGPTIGGGAKAKPKAEKYENLSLRKLKAVYKETVVSKKGEDKRAALRDIDENRI